VSQLKKLKSLNRNYNSKVVVSLVSCELCGKTWKNSNTEIVDNGKEIKIFDGVDVYNFSFVFNKYLAKQLKMIEPQPDSEDEDSWDGPNITWYGDCCPNCYEELLKTMVDKFNDLSKGNHNEV